MTESSGRRGSGAVIGGGALRPVSQVGRRFSAQHPQQQFQQQHIYQHSQYQTPPERQTPVHFIQQQQSFTPSPVAFISDLSDGPSQEHPYIHSITSAHGVSSGTGASSGGCHHVVSPNPPSYYPSQEPAMTNHFPRARLIHDLDVTSDLSQDVTSVQPSAYIHFPNTPMAPDRFLKSRLEGGGGGAPQQLQPIAVGDLAMRMTQMTFHESMRQQPPPSTGTPTYLGHQQKLHTSNVGHFSSHSVSPNTFRPLAPIRKVKDTVTGTPEYFIDPFCPSNMEFQRQAEDELAKFIYKLVQHVAKSGVRGLKYENPQSRSCDIDAAEALKGAALDFRWQMKHLEYNRSQYCNEVFNQRIKVEDLKTWTRNLREKADKLAHKQHLQDHLRVDDERIVSGILRKDETLRSREPKTGTIDAIQTFLDEVVTFTERIYLNQRDKIPDLVEHRRNIRDIRETFLDFMEYRVTLQGNMTTFAQLDPGIKRRTVAEKVLEQFQIMLKSEKAAELIAVRLSAHFGINIAQL